MIGAAYQTAVGADANTLFSVNITPSNVFVMSSNGSSSSPTCRSTVISGIGPFEYLWEIDNPDISMSNTTGDSCRFSAGGYNTEVTGNATLTVTDKGNSDTTTSKTLRVDFNFEDNL